MFRCCLETPICINIGRMTSIPSTESTHRDLLNRMKLVELEFEIDNAIKWTYPQPFGTKDKSDDWSASNGAVDVSLIKKKERNK